MTAATTPPENAAPGDACGLIRTDGSVCDGTIQCYVDAVGPVPDCHCHISPPCSACIEAPLVCDACGETVP